MTKGILGKKVGMTQIFGENGELIPVTVIEAAGNVVLQKKTEEVDGYNAVQIGFDDKQDYKPTRRTNKYATKSEMGLVHSSGASPKRVVLDFRHLHVAEFHVGQEVNVDTFEAGDIVHVTGTSKGNGYQGNIQRHIQAKGPSSHGSRYHSRPG